jgi:putative transposase
MPRVGPEKNRAGAVFLTCSSRDAIIRIMGRLPRAVQDDLVYHAVNRGNNRAEVFGDETDYASFLDDLARTKERYPFRLYGYCLMPDHFHLLLLPDAGQSISRILQSLTVAHTGHYHRRHQTSGHVWQGRFKSPGVQDNANLLVVLRYIEANPVRAGIVTDPGSYRWSSFPYHGLGQDDPLLDPSPAWEQLGRTEGERRRRWRTRLAARQKEAEVTAVRTSLRNGRPFGDPDWTRMMAQRMGLPLVARPRGRPRKTS